MKFPSEPNETERTEFVQAALREAAHYEAETVAPENLVAGALARHERAGRRCGPSPRLAPAFAGSVLGIALVAGGTLWLRMPHHLPEKSPGSPRMQTMHPGNTSATAIPSWLPRFDLVAYTLPPIHLEQFASLPAHPRLRHRIARHTAHRRQHSQLARNQPLPIQKPATHSLWTTETVRCEVITQTVTPVWVARQDPETATIILTPALFQLALQPDEADSSVSQVAATLIPIRLEQENKQP